ncbi:hypothetical protein [Pseudomonas sp. MPB26]|uniref:hypothetical protein n=1 Tax=Pseudomonas sp. MPB26 TaxID=3388491 RepID=UPI0039853DF3
MNKLLGTALLVFLIQGCSYQKTNITNEVEKNSYNPESSSRVRVFTSPEVTGRFKSFESCEQTRQIKNENDMGFKNFRDRTPTKTYLLWRRVDLLGMMEEDYKNRVIGIPATLTTESVKTERLGYNEYVLPAGKPTLFIMKYFVTSDSGKFWCYPDSAYLTPKQGKDYEVKLEFEKTGLMSSACKVVVSEITGGESIKQVQSVNSNSCMSD